MAIENSDDLISAFINKTIYDFGYTSATAVASSLMDADYKCTPKTCGNMSTPAAYTAGGTLHYGSSTGFYNFPAKTSGTTKYLLARNHHSTGGGIVYLMDRVWSCSGMSANTTATQTISSFPTLPRLNTSPGLGIYVEVYTAIGSTAPVCTVTYTNCNGTTGRVTPSTTLVASAASGRLFYIPLQAGDESIGVASVQSLTFSTASGTAGDVGIVLAKKLNMLPNSTANQGFQADWAIMGLPEVEDSAAIATWVQCSSTFTGSGYGSIIIGYT